MRIKIVENREGVIRAEPLVIYEGTPPDIGELVKIGLGAIMLQPQYYEVVQRTWELANIRPVQNLALVEVCVLVRRVEGV